MHSLLKAYETSISQSVSRSCAPDLLWGTGKLSILTYPFTATRHTYQWLDELNSRENSINYLINHELSDMLSPIHNWPSLDLPKNELSSLLQIFKRRALVLLYALADSAAGRPYALATTRKRQADFLESLSIKDLAAIGCIIEVMGQGYWNIIKKGLAELEYKDSLLGLRKSQRPPNLFIPRSVKWVSRRKENIFWLTLAIETPEILTAIIGSESVCACLRIEFNTMDQRMPGHSLQDVQSQDGVLTHGLATSWK